MSGFTYSLPREARFIPLFFGAVPGKNFDWILRPEFNESWKPSHTKAFEDRTIYIEPESTQTDEYGSFAYCILNLSTDLRRKPLSEYVAITFVFRIKLGKDAGNRQFIRFVVALALEGRFANEWVLVNASTLLAAKLLSPTEEGRWVDSQYNQLNRSDWSSEEATSRWRMLSEDLLKSVSIPVTEDNDSTYYSNTELLSQNNTISAAWDTAGDPKDSFNQLVHTIAKSAALLHASNIPWGIVGFGKFSRVDSAFNLLWKPTSDLSEGTTQIDNSIAIEQFLIHKLSLQKNMLPPPSQDTNSSMHSAGEADPNFVAFVKGQQHESIVPSQSETTADQTDPQIRVRRPLSNEEPREILSLTTNSQKVLLSVQEELGELRRQVASLRRAHTQNWLIALALYVITVLLLSLSKQLF